MYLNKTK